MQGTLQLALDLPLDIAQFYAAAPFPGTALWEKATRRGWLIPEAVISQDRACMNLPQLPASAVDAFRKIAYRKFYMRGSAIKRILNMLERRGIMDIASNAKSVIRQAVA
jgi:hypothetical protein